LAEEILPALPDREPSPEESATAAEDRERLRVRVDGLPPAQQTVLHLRMHTDLTFAEIDRRTGQTAAQACESQRLAIRRLRRSLRRAERS
jgi:DNA-directed RNA polymerase specialized sigma24 family protein